MAFGPKIKSQAFIIGEALILYITGISDVKILCFLNVYHICYCIVASLAVIAPRLGRFVFFYIYYVMFKHCFLHSLVSVYNNASQVPRTGSLQSQVPNL